jgi:hypothetical protein
MNAHQLLDQFFVDSIGRSILKHPIVTFRTVPTVMDQATLDQPLTQYI